MTRQKTPNTKSIRSSGSYRFIKPYYALSSDTHLTVTYLLNETLLPQNVYTVGSLVPLSIELVNRGSPLQNHRTVFSRSTDTIMVLIEDEEKRRQAWERTVPFLILYQSNR